MRLAPYEKPTGQSTPNSQLLPIPHGVVDDGNLISIQFQERLNGLLVHRATRHGAESGCRAEEVDVLAHDAHIDTYHPL